MCKSPSTTFRLRLLTNFPSVFVNGRPRSAIMENMRARIDRGDIEAERTEAIQVRSLFHASTHNP